MFDVRTMAERAQDALIARRMPAAAATAFGLVALTLSVIGVYGVLAYLIAQRTREIGIRIALGSTPRDVFTLILREGVPLVAAGFGFGLAGALILSRNLQSLLFGRRIHPIVALRFD